MPDGSLAGEILVMSPVDECVASCPAVLDAPLLEDAIPVAAGLSAHLIQMARAILPDDIAGGCLDEALPKQLCRIGEDMDSATVLCASERTRLGCKSGIQTAGRSDVPGVDADFPSTVMTEV